ncbi:MAG: hypothetical protein ACKVU0_19735 [Saprospiraceae bacterium]
MISRTNKSFVWLWMAALLSATVGVSVQKVYCYCLGKTTVSLFAADDACQSENTDRVTQSPPVSIPFTLESDCCKKNTPAKKACCQNADTEKQGCTKKTTQVFQLKAEFEVGSQEFKKFDFLKAWAILPHFCALPQVFLDVQKVNLQGFERPPPSSSGRMICVRHGVFRC